MAMTLASPLLSGLAFGTALHASGVGDPTIILGQFKLRNFHMMTAFLSASACSALIIYFANRSSYAKLGPRGKSNLGLFTFDGNVIGGAMQGIAMAVSGACPGTVLVQLANGIESGRWVLLGGVLGGLGYVLVGESWKKTEPATTRDKVKASSEVKTFQDKFQVSTEKMIVVYEGLLAGVIVMARMFAPMQRYWLNPVVGGVLIGVAQAMSVLLTKGTLGVSSAYESVARHVVRAINSTRKNPGYGSIVFAIGVTLGAKLVSLHLPMSAPVASVSSTAAILGGFLSIFGARLAGGCTSGHGISGMSTLSVSSLVTVASMFGGGIAWSMLLG